MAWQEIPIKNKVFQNVAESALGNLNAAIENCYITDTGGLARFPRLNTFCTLSGAAPTYLDEWRGDLIAVTGGQTYRIDPFTGAYRDVTGLAVSGSGRVVFSATENEKLMAAGRSIVRLAGPMTELLSEQAPESTHVGFVSGRVVAIEPRSGRFSFSPAGQYTQWDPLDVLSAEGKPDNIAALLVTEFGELVLAGTESIEQFDPSPNGTRPFFKRWGLGIGLYAPYTILSADNRIWGLNNKREWVAFSSQLSNTASEDIQRTLDKVDDWTDAWSVELSLGGQRFIVLQAPFATNVYGTKGITFLFDYLKERWGTLYGWDESLSLPTKWEGWSYVQINSKKFVGGNGCVYTLDGYDGDTPQKMLWRSGHISRPGNQSFRINKLSMRLNRGETMMNGSVPKISIRANKDNMGFGRWSHATMAVPGKQSMTLNFPAMGNCDSVQFEIRVTDDGPIDIARFDMDVTNLGR